MTSSVVPSSVVLLLLIMKSLSWSFPSIFLDMSPHFSEGIPTSSFLSAMNYSDISLKLSQQLCSGLFHMLPTSELITNTMLYTEQALRVYRIKWRESLHLSEQWRWKETMKCFRFTISWYTGFALKRISRNLSKALSFPDFRTS